MNLGSGFTDLRLDRQECQNQESFWPSFTDIMTVILMIFMITMVVLLLRNMELVRQLRATMAAERSAVELARSTGEEKEDLALKLVAATTEISLLQLRLMQLEKERTRQKSTISSQTGEITELLSRLELLTLQRDQLSAEKQGLEQRLKRSRKNARNLRLALAEQQQNLQETRQQLRTVMSQLNSLEAEVDSLNALSDAIREQLAGLQQRYQQRGEELQQVRQAERKAGNRLNALQGEHDELQVKYNELFRPARSPAGRYRVEVRYSKIDGRERIEYATADDPDFKPISRKQLEQRLSRLKRDKKAGLYIKIIFPDRSGLSFNEAWSFTSALHSRYDYYFQDRKMVPATPSRREGRQPVPAMEPEKPGNQ
jgi:chromosome segregation ATPase